MTEEQWKEKCCPLMTFGGVERDAKWIDENYFNIPRDPMLEIREAIEKICNEYINSPYANEERINLCRRWLTICRIEKDMDDELL